MVSRLTFVLITLFWVTMNILLWQSEYGAGRSGSAVPVTAVWQKMLTAPDNSNLTVIYKGRRIGFARWSVNIGQELATGQISTDEYAPEGRVEKLTDYSIDLEGAVSPGSASDRLTFDLSLKLARNQAWREARLRSSYQRDRWELRSLAAEESVHLRTDNAGQRWETTIGFAELRNPAKLLTDYLGPTAPAMAMALGLPMRPTALGGSPPTLRLPWEARYDWITIARSRVRAYRISARLLDRHQIVIYVSRVGEIIRVELPGDVILANDGITSFEPAP